MEIRYDLSKLNTKPIHIDKNHKNNIILYCVETIHNTPYLYFLMIKNANDILQLPYCVDSRSFMKESFTTSEYDYKGYFTEGSENYIFYQVDLHETDFVPTLENDVWWKVTPFEILYSGEVLQYKVDKKCILFFQANPELLLLYENNVRYEMPVTGYIGIGITELNDQILMHNKNVRKGRFKKGHYFGSVEKAFNNSVYDVVESFEYIIQLVNHNYITNIIPIENTTVTVKSNKFYLDDTFLGDVPSNCKITGEYELHYFDENAIYLKTNNNNECSPIYHKKREEIGCIMRYILFLGNHWVGTKTKKGFDSFAYDEEYMIKHTDHFSCISYHLIDKNIEMHGFKKDVVVIIK